VNITPGTAGAGQSASREKAGWSAGDDPGTVAPSRVEVSVAVPGRRRAVWRALTDPDAAARWFCAATAPLTGDGLTTISLLDGDQFLAQRLAAEPPGLLRYVQAAMGVGVENTITWRIRAADGGCLVTVTDDEPGRTAPRAARDARRWREILGRLRRHLAGGRPQRSCSDRFEAAVEFTATETGAAALLLDPTSHGRWLPTGGATLTDGAPMHDCTVADLRADPAHGRLSFHLIGPGRPTRVRLETGPRDRGAQVSVRHDGWHGLGPADRQQERARWCRVWSAALRRFTLLYVRGRDLGSIPADELRSRLGDDRTYVFDTNVRSRWDRGHLAGAIHLGPEPYRDEVLPADKAATLIFYCLSPI
jgi:uncharacterized protein YndB with AHSA1/START domain